MPFMKTGKSPIFSMENTKGLKVLGLEKVKSSPLTNRVHAILN